MIKGLLNHFYLEAFGVRRIKGSLLRIRKGKLRFLFHYGTWGSIRTWKGWGTKKPLGRVKEGNG